MNTAHLMKLILFIAGILIGIASTFFLFGKNDSHEVCMEHEARNFLVDSIISSINLIDSGNTGSAESILATAVNSQVLVIRKMRSSSAEDKAKGEEWNELMKKHNDRLGLRIPESKKP